MKISRIVFGVCLFSAMSVFAQGGNFFSPSKTRVPPEINRVFFSRYWNDAFSGYNFVTGKGDSIFAIAKGVVTAVIDSSEYSHDGANILILHELANQTKMLVGGYPFHLTHSPRSN